MKSISIRRGVQEGGTEHGPKVAKTEISTARTMRDKQKLNQEVRAGDTRRQEEKYEERVEIG